MAGNNEGLPYGFHFADQMPFLLDNGELSIQIQCNSSKNESKMITYRACYYILDEKHWLCTEAGYPRRFQSDPIKMSVDSRLTP